MLLPSYIFEPSFQLISEFVILALRVEDGGSFFCSAENPAGVARANFTVHVLAQSGDGVKSSVVHHSSDSKGDSAGGDSFKTFISAEGPETSDMYKVSNTTSHFTNGKTLKSQA